MFRGAQPRRASDAGLAAGYASDDEVAPTGSSGQRWRPPQGYGALPGDRSDQRRVGGQASVDYGIRQNMSGSKRQKTRFLDAVVAPMGRPAPRPSGAQTKARISAYERHQQLLARLPQGPAKPFKTDFQVLVENHRFLRSAEDDDGSWESKLAQRYYERLFREYVICDLAGYRTGEVGFRWRTEAEVMKGRGQFSCGHKRCEATTSLRSYEVDFKYREAGQKKRALVKARLCEACGYKLHYRHIKAARRRQRAEAEAKETKSEGTHTENEDPSKERLKSDPNEEDQKSGDDLEGKRVPDGEPDEAEKKLLAAMIWKGPDPETRTREDDFDDYLSTLFM